MRSTTVIQFNLAKFKTLTAKLTLMSINFKFRHTAANFSLQNYILMTEEENAKEKTSLI